MSLTEPSVTGRREVYGRSARKVPLWMWIFQRYSGLLLGPLVFIHVLVPRAPFVVWLTSLMLAILLGHAFIGLWRLAGMKQLTRTVSRYAIVGTVVVIAVIGVFGILLLYSLS
jgi:succinate dehydrogenase hydrophobic anchor subunit